MDISLLVSDEKTGDNLSFYLAFFTLILLIIFYYLLFVKIRFIFLLKRIRNNTIFEKTSDNELVEKTQQYKSPYLIRKKVLLNSSEATRKYKSFNKKFKIYTFCLLLFIVLELVLIFSKTGS